MSKRGYISRYLLIIKKLKAKPYATFGELQGHIDHQQAYMQLRDDTLAIAASRRTLQRDLKEIRNLFGIDIEYSKREKGYYISSDMESLNFQHMMEAFDVFNSLNLAQGLSPFIHLEARRPQGTDNLYGLLHAIKNRLLIKFDYQKFWDDKPTPRTADPYGMKEFKNRWYVIARDHKDSKIKSFALDRLTNFELTNKKFTYPQGFSIEQYYRNFFGIISPADALPQEILLSFDPHQGKYIKTLPLHHSQKIVVDNEDELQITLTLCITDDFIMELLSHGDMVKVLAPDALVKTISGAHKEAYLGYN